MNGVGPYYTDDQVTLWCGDALHVLTGLPDGSVDCVVTSPPYFGLRDYGLPGQYGLEATPTAYVETMRAVFAEVRRVLTPTGTLWLNLGDTYAGKANGGPSVGMTRRADRADLIPSRRNTTGEAPYKSLLMIPARVAGALVDDGWCLRNRIVWHKTDAMPESVRDRFASRYEDLFLLTRTARYWFDLDAVREPASRVDRGKSWPERRAAGAPRRHGVAGAAAAGDNDFAVNPVGRNPGDVWAYSTAGFPEAHFAVMPPPLPNAVFRPAAGPVAPSSTRSAVPEPPGWPLSNTAAGSSVSTSRRPTWTWLCGPGSRKRPLSMTCPDPGGPR